MSWRKFYSLFNKSYQKCQQMFTNKLGGGVRLRDQIRGGYQIVHKKLERECERKACKYKEFERFRSDWGKKNEMYTGLIWFKLGLCDRDKV